MQKLPVWTTSMNKLSDYDKIRYLLNARDFRPNNPRRAVYTRQINIIKRDMEKTAHGRLMLAEIED